MQEEWPTVDALKTHTKPLNHSKHPCCPYKRRDAGGAGNSRGLKIAHKALTPLKTLVMPLQTQGCRRSERLPTPFHTLLGRPAITPFLCAIFRFYVCVCRKMYIFTYTYACTHTYILFTHIYYVCVCVCVHINMPVSLGGQ